MWEHRARIVVSYATESLADTVPRALIVLGIGIAGFVAAWIFYKIGSCCAYKPRKKHADEQKLIEEMKSRARFRRGAIVRAVFMILSVASILIGLTIGFHAAGFNFFTIAYTGGFITLVITYSFGSSLQSAMAYFLINISEKIEDGQMIEVEGTPVKGRVMSIGIFWVEIQYTDQKGKVKEYQLPTHMALSNIVGKEIGTIDIPQKTKMKEAPEGVRRRLTVENMV